MKSSLSVWRAEYSNLLYCRMSSFGRLTEKDKGVCSGLASPTRNSQRRAHGPQERLLHTFSCIVVTPFRPRTVTKLQQRPQSADAFALRPRRVQGRRSTFLYAVLPPQRPRKSASCFARNARNVEALKQAHFGRVLKGVLLACQHGGSCRLDNRAIRYSKMSMVAR